jgi:hypothetical protein
VQPLLLDGLPLKILVLQEFLVLEKVAVAVQAEPEQQPEAARVLPFSGSVLQAAARVGEIWGLKIV